MQAAFGLSEVVGKAEACRALAVPRILQQPDFELQRTVWITAEVPFPGAYTLTRKDEGVSDLVVKAGGFLQSAYPESARFLRRTMRVA